MTTARWPMPAENDAEAEQESARISRTEAERLEATAKARAELATKEHPLSD